MYCMSEAFIFVLNLLNALIFLIDLRLDIMLDHVVHKIVRCSYRHLRLNELLRSRHRTLRQLLALNWGVCCGLLRLLRLLLHWLLLHWLLMHWINHCWSVRILHRIILRLVHTRSILLWNSKGLCDGRLLLLLLLRRHWICMRILRGCVGPRRRRTRCHIPKLIIITFLKKKNL